MGKITCKVSKIASPASLAEDMFRRAIKQYVENSVILNPAELATLINSAIMLEQNKKQK